MVGFRGSKVPKPPAIATALAPVSYTHLDVYKRQIPHPALEALFTIDEETGMTGAMGLKPGQLHGQILLNLDTEEDDELSLIHI